MTTIKLIWAVSYETILFDTVDGDLGKEQYAINPKGGWFVRKHPKNNHQFVNTDNPSDIVEKDEVQIMDMRGAYYNVFNLPNGRSLRIQSTHEKYNGLRYVKDYSQPKKSVADAEIAEITKDDHLWQ